MNSLPQLCRETAFASAKLGLFFFLSKIHLLAQAPIFMTDPTSVLACCFGVASLSGLAVLLRSNKQLTVRLIVASILYDGLAGLIIGLLSYNYYEGQKNFYFMIAMSGLAGMGRISLVDVSVLVLQTVSAIISKNTPKPPSQDP